MFAELVFAWIKPRKAYSKGSAVYGSLEQWVEYFFK
jgi:hypothetical protein